MKVTLRTFAIAAVLAALASPAWASIYGTMSNFDVFNDTPQDSYGAELELEGVHSTDVCNTYPSHYDHRSVTEYSDGVNFGTRVTFTGYNFTPAGYIPPTVGQSTNGHTCVNTPGCEHFGFAVSTQPTATRYFWLDAAGQRIGNMPMSVPTPSWNYVPPAGGGRAEVVAAVELPDPEDLVQRPDAVWMKVFKTELPRAAKLRELMSGDDIVPEDEIETETEWELLEDGMVVEAQDQVDDNDKAVIRRYEFFKYTGAYTDEHEADSTWDSTLDPNPPADELGDFIAANMVAANLENVAIVEGDYNGDGVVDGADYIMWRHNKGSEVRVLVDGDYSNVVDDGDYDVWRDRFGRNPAAGALAGSSVVPEPASLVLVITGIGLVAIRRRRGK